MKIVEAVTVAQGLDAAPVRVRNRKPFTVPGPDVDVDRTEVVVLLVTRCP